MQKVSYMGNGSTTEFTFNFPYFENSDVVVTKNGVAASGYNIVGNSAGLDADIPYTGGKVVFETAPTALDSITIARSLPLARQYDYQPLEKISPTTLNQDLNYLMEKMKDLHDELEYFCGQCDILSHSESIENLSTKMDRVITQITELNADTESIGGIPGIAPKMNTLDTRTTGLLDYVIESQAPTADNNYTWYRKYKSGWVEQGGIQNGNVSIEYGAEGSLGTINLPVTMASSNYILLATGNGFTTLVNIVATNSTCIPKFGTYGTTARTLTQVRWYVCGMAAS